MRGERLRGASGRTRLCAVVALTTIGVVAVFTAQRAPASDGARARIAVLATRGDTTEVRVVEVSFGASFGASFGVDGGRGEVAARIRHAEDGVVRGAIVDGSTLLVAVEDDTGRDRSFSGALYRVDLRALAGTGEPAPATVSRLAVDRLAYASTPIVAGRMAYLQRGRAGLAGEPRRMRDDELTITQLDLDTGRTREVLALHGQLAYPVGVAEGSHELVAYLLGPPGTIGDGGRLVGLALDTPHVGIRDLGPIGAARDLSLAARGAVVDADTAEALRTVGPAVIYEGRDPDGARAVFAVALAQHDGRAATRQRLVRGARTPLSPLVSAEGTLYTNADALGTGGVASADPTVAGGQALDIVRAIAPLGAVARPSSSATRAARGPACGLSIWQRYLPREPLPRLVVREGAAALTLPQARGERLEPVGFLVAR